MPIPFTCPHCGHSTLADDKFAGLSGPCCQCGKQVTVPLAVSRGSIVPEERSAVSSGVALVLALGFGVVLLLVSLVMWGFALVPW